MTLKTTTVACGILLTLSLGSVGCGGEAPSNLEESSDAVLTTAPEEELPEGPLTCSWRYPTYAERERISGAMFDQGFCNEASTRVNGLLAMNEIRLWDGSCGDEDGHTSPDGTVYINIQYRDWALGYIMAHEIGHVIQFEQLNDLYMYAHHAAMEDDAWAYADLCSEQDITWEETSPFADADTESTSDSDTTSTGGGGGGSGSDDSGDTGSTGPQTGWYEPTDYSGSTSGGSSTNTVQVYIGDIEQVCGEGFDDCGG